MAEVTLSTEDMLLVMELAGWTYVPESDHDYAHAYPDNNLGGYIWNNHGSQQGHPEANKYPRVLYTVS